MTSVKERYSELMGRFFEVVLMALGLMLAAVLIVVVFRGLLDLQVMFQSFASFEAGDAIGIIDSLLVGLIVIEIFRNIEAYLKNVSVVPVAINVAILAVTRQIIIHRPESYDGSTSYLLTGLAYGVMMGILLVAYYVTAIKEPREDLQEGTEHVI
jgi:uncharacterized membrane protein (DUF373 family)